MCGLRLAPGTSSLKPRMGAYGGRGRAGWIYSTQAKPRLWRGTEGVWVPGPSCPARLLRLLSSRRGRERDPWEPLPGSAGVGGSQDPTAAPGPHAQAATSAANCGQGAVAPVRGRQLLGRGPTRHSRAEGLTGAWRARTSREALVRPETRRPRPWRHFSVGLRGRVRAGGPGRCQTEQRMRPAAFTWACRGRGLLLRGLLRWREPSTLPRWPARPLPGAPWLCARHLSEEGFLGSGLPGRPRGRGVRGACGRASSGPAAEPLAPTLAERMTPPEPHLPRRLWAPRPRRRPRSLRSRRRSSGGSWWPWR